MGRAKVEETSMANRKRNREKRLVEERERLRKNRILNGEQGSYEDRSRLQIEELMQYVKPVVYRLRQCPSKISELE